MNPANAEQVAYWNGPSAVTFAMTAGPTARLLRDVADDARERVRRELEATLRPLLRGGRLALAGATWLVHARA